MPTPKAVKKNLAQLEQEIARLTAIGELDDQTVQLFQSLLSLVTTVVMLLVEKKTPKSLLNSFIPSSMSEADETAKKLATNSQNKGHSHTHAECNNTGVEVEHRDSEVTEYDCCGADSTAVKVVYNQRCTLVDIVIVKKKPT